MNLNDLRKSPLFQGLSDDELQRLMDMAEPLSLRVGECLIRQGDMGDAAYVVLSGELEIQKQTGNSLIKIDVRNPGDVVGEMALLSNATRNASVIAKSNVEVLRIPQDAFVTLLTSSPGAAMAVLHWVMARLHQNEALLHQQEKMAALGTLSAGLAHELNNPAAAAQRSAAELNRTLIKWQMLTHEVEAAALKEGKIEWLGELMKEAVRRYESPVKLEALDRLDRVESLQAWLEANGVESAWEFAPAMVNFGWDDSSLEKFKSTTLFQSAVQWLGTSCLVMSLLSEVRETTERLSGIVRAMKSYTYLDQAPLLEVDLHEGLENTLTILQHKLKQGVTIKREYSPNLPRIEAYASELNQVWTNIIDNAIDAMGGKGEIVLRTTMMDDKVLVEIADNGPGIPEANQTRIFEPFFTTKAFSSRRGTGLGLFTVYEFAREMGHGLMVESTPGKGSTFTIFLPVADREPATPPVHVGI